MIITGYQGIGKSTVCKDRYDWIDLESSIFKDDAGNRANNWYEHYCAVAVHLSNQGYTVFMSSHKVVRDWLSVNFKGRWVAIVPSTQLESEWVDRLEQRALDRPSIKNIAAYKNAVQHYSDSIRNIMYTCPAVILSNIDYDLAEIVENLLLGGKHDNTNTGKK